MQLFTVHNLTPDPLLFQTAVYDEKPTNIMPSACALINVQKKRIRQRTDLIVISAEGPGERRTHVVKLDKCKMALGVSWNLISNDGPWRVYRAREGNHGQKLVVLPKRDMWSYLAYMPDSALLSSLTLPGTHDTLALHGWPISQCQSLDTPLTVQLTSGIRVIDVRLAVVNSRLIAYHGIYPQRTPFQDILKSVQLFLESPRGERETIVMSIKQEDFVTTPAPTFSAMVHSEIFNGPGGAAMWFLDNRVPKLGEVRGKVVMLSRFGGNGDGWDRGLEGLGIHPTTWPDSEKAGFSWTCKDTVVRTHDWYNIPTFLSIPDKVALATQNITAEDEPDVPTLRISYTSAASFPLALPPTVAQGFGWPQLGFGVEGVNARLGRWLIDSLSNGSTPTEPAPSPACCEKAVEGEEAPIGNSGTGVGPRIRGWVFMDFYTAPVEDGLVPLLVECNFRWRRAEEEGWCSVAVV